MMVFNTLNLEAFCKSHSYLLNAQKALISRYVSTVFLFLIYCCCKALNLLLLQFTVATPEILKNISGWTVFNFFWHVVEKVVSYNSLIV